MATNFPDQTPDARRLAPSVRALAATCPVTTAEALTYLEREHGLVGLDARRARRGEAHDPGEARAEILRRYLAAFGPPAKGAHIPGPRSRPMHA